MAQIRQVVSESLQATIRRLLPSQQGFTEDLQASNVIQPIIDLTPTAEGSTLGVNLQTALSHADISTFFVNNTTTNVITNTGYWRVFGAFNGSSDTANTADATIFITDGTTSKQILHFLCIPNTSSGSGNAVITPFDFVVYMTAGDTLGFTADNLTIINGVVRQLADVDGNLINPS